MKGRGNPSMKSRRRLRLAGLFAGIGGIELGLERAGHKPVLFCESDQAAQAVLRAKFDAPLLHDVTKLSNLPRGTDLVAAGFPCQNLSQAGRTEGMDGHASGLVRWIFRLLRKNPVPWVLLENVPFMMQLEKGRALRYIVTQLERLDYRWAYRVVDSRAFGLPQRRKRVYIVASLDGDPRDVLLADDAGPPEIAEVPWGSVAYGFYWTEGWRGLGWAVDSIPPLKGGSGIGIPAPPAVLLPDGRVVTPGIRDAERLQGFEADWTSSAESLGDKGRRLRWRLVGNAVTVKVAEWIGARMAQPGDFKRTNESRLDNNGPWPVAAWNVGDGRFRAHVSRWPVRVSAPPLAKFLCEPELLSARASAGFLSRAASAKATIRCEPEFLAALQRHLDRVTSNGRTTAQVKVA